MPRCSNARAPRHDLPLKQRDTTIERLQEQVRLLLAKRFAASPEKLPDGQLGLFNEAGATAAEEPESDSGTDLAAHRRAKAERGRSTRRCGKITKDRSTR